MKALKYILFLILILSIGLTIYIAVQPNSFEVKRTRTINTPAEVIYNNVIDFKNWNAWSPWVEKDPNASTTLGEQTKDVGASYAWETADGSGKIKTIATTKNSSISQNIQLKDFQPSQMQWEFNPQTENITEVSWTIHSDNIPFKQKAYAIFMGGFDEMIGSDLERGLEKLDGVVVASMKIYSVKVDGITHHGGGFYLYNTTSAKINDYDTVKHSMLTELTTYVQKNNITTAGSPYVLYHKWDEENNAVMFSCCVPTTNQVITIESDILTGQLEPFKAVKTTLKGDYSNLKEAWEITRNYITEHGLQSTERGAMLEVYVIDQTTTLNPANWTTELYLAVEQP